jgi:Flp pilus assembly protein TadB
MELPIDMITFSASIIFGILAMILQYYAYRRGKKGERKREEETEKRFDRLSNILKEASSEIEKMEKEIRVKGKKVQDLEELSKRLDNLASLKEEQVRAIRQEFSSALKESSKSNRIWTVLIGAIWFIIGLIVRGFLGF